MNVEIMNEASFLGIYVLNFRYSDFKSYLINNFWEIGWFTIFFIFGKIFLNEKICQKTSWMQFKPLKKQCHEIFCFRFFS